MEKCEICGRETFKLLTHHISYNPERTQAICGTCHKELIRSGKHVRRPRNFRSSKPPSSIEPCIIDETGRLTIPKRFRVALGLPEGQKYSIWVEAYPDLKDCKSLIIKR